MNRDHLTLADVAREAGVAYGTLRLWCKTKGKAIRSDSIRDLAEFVGISFDQSLLEIGGPTAEQRQSQLGRASIVKNSPNATDPGGPKALAAHRKQAQTMRGMKKSPEHVAAVVEAKKRNGTHDLFLEAARANNESPTIRAIRSLAGYLRGKGQAQPTSVQLNEWAIPVAERLKLPTKAVVNIWRDWLRAHGIGSFGGRPQEIDWPQVDKWRLQAAPMTWGAMAIRTGRTEATLKNGYRPWRNS